MRSKKIIYFIRTSSPFLSQRRDVDYIIENLILNGYHVDLYDSKKKVLYKINTREIVDYALLPNLSSIKIYSFLSNILSLVYFTLKNRKKYNIVQLSYIQEEYLLFPRLIHSVGDKLILNLYGSDINLRNAIKNTFTKIYDLADAIVATNQSFIEKTDVFLKNKNILSKSKVIMLPQKHFSFYQDFTFENKIESKKRLNLPLDKIIISLGTSGIKNEQLEDLIQSISKNNQLDQFFFLVNISKNESSIDQMKNMIFSFLNPQQCILFESFVSYEDMSIVRHATDIFINTRKIDQLAVSMMESNLSYSYIISGSWLPYTDYKQSIKINEIDDISEVNSKINDFIKLNKNELSILLDQNKINVLKKYDSQVLQNWLDFYLNFK
jgi:hypothetical protein